MILKIQPTILYILDWNSLLFHLNFLSVVSFYWLKIKVISIDFHDLNFFEVCFFIFFVELAQQLIFVSHLFRHFGQQMEDKMLQRFLWPIDN